jgi:MerR family regulatory protein
VPDRTGRSIGEVLEELRDDFPDISVSKIRFLESQGLINPNRTASGYRQFSDADVALLRWILQQQREHYLPLKVIRRRLRDGGGPAPPPTGDPAISQAPAVLSGGTPGPPAVSGGTPGPPAVSGGTPGPPGDEAVWLVPEDRVPVATPAEAVPATLPLEPAPMEVRGPGPVPAAAIEPVVAASVPAPPPGSEEGLWASGGNGPTYTRAELAEAVGLDERALAELESFGLLPRTPGGDYDDDARRVAELAAAFAAFGVEARHLRMYKSFAEREAAFLEQVVMPIANPRRSESRAQAREALADLARLGQALRTSMLRAALGPPPG